MNKIVILCEKNKWTTTQHKQSFVNIIKYEKHRKKMQLNSVQTRQESKSRIIYLIVIMISKMIDFRIEIKFLAQL